MFLKCSKSQFFKIKIYLHNREYQQKSFKLRGPTIQIACDQVIVVNVLYKYLQGDRHHVNSLYKSVCLRLQGDRVL